MELTDQNFINLFKKGDIGAFEKVFTTFFMPLHIYAFLMIKDEALAEEIVQEIFYRVWEKKEKLSIHTSLKAYFYTSVYHECLAQLKKQKRHSIYQLTMLHRRKNELPAEDASEKIQHRQLEEKFHEALNHLPEQCRTIFLLNRVEKLNYHEVATQLGVSLKTVEKQMGKALKLLRQRLAEFLPLLIYVVCYL